MRLPTSFLRALRSRENRRRRGLLSSVGDFLRVATKAFLVVAPWVLLGGFVVGLPSAVAIGWNHLAALPTFQVSEVDIAGHQHIDRETIEARVGYRGPDTNIFTIDPEAAEERLEELAWVRWAHVERLLPDRITVVIEERQVGGLVMLDQLYLADEHGTPFKIVEDEPDVDMPIVTGLGKNLADLDESDFARIRQAFALMKLYDHHGLAGFDRLSEVQVEELTGFAFVTERRRIRILLGEDRFDERLRRLGDVYAAIQERDIHARTIRLDNELALDRIAVSTVASP